MEWKDLKDKITGPGDAAAFLLGFTAGFAVDVLLFPLGLPPGTVAGVAGTGALGAKKAWDAGRVARHERQRQTELDTSPKKRIEWLRSLPNPPKEMKDGLNLIEGGWTNGAFTRDEVLQHLDKVLTKYRESLPPGSAFPF